MTAMANPAEVADRSAALCSVPAKACRVDAGGKRTPVTWQLPEEVPVALLINSAPYTVMMATPANLTDFGIGFVLAEGIVPHRGGHPRRARHAGRERPRGRYRHRRGSAADARMPRRSIEGRSGCGLCGVENIADVVRVTEPVARSRPACRAILKAAAELPKRSP